MTDFMELCLRRQSCRSFSGRPVEHEKLVRCVEAAHYAPSGCNAQPWSFIVVEDSSMVKKVVPHVRPMEMNGFCEKAAAFILVVEEHATLVPLYRNMIDSQYFARFDAGSATAYLCLEAESLGIGTCILGSFNRDALRELLEISMDKPITMVVALGYPETPQVRQKNRKPLEEVARFI